MACSTTTTSPCFGMEKLTVASCFFLLLSASLLQHSVKTLNEECRVTSTYTYTVAGGSQTVNIARLRPYYAVQVDGMPIYR
ncbi:hypothetical protein PF005_g15055 [Phytophthora fragariae]|uniref:Uncharacterized protein n=1 Tax=Phytophthora fragariae TaxID=53985 RepID=A0A6A4DF57_9STRA|nr:hypothetical protein PF003_g35768 [Phytophthora fragariae]KAE8925949.1 hypothetical protein PF009_g23852 [Phytophthora fragariae]KAE9000598.1 hypothetical protein PF011_g14112 [Phytophthora fragariae]KAE9100796.1 hypothetical protein PF007_g15378 [Phytophthora fragariae]KAE9101053.1 hypothetical protein PF010_g14580 [Phytophthora fragariae]